MLSRLSIDGWNLDALTGASAIVLALLPATGLAGERAARVCTRLGAKSTALPRHPPAANRTS
jgi:hypothetical protein